MEKIVFNPNRPYYVNYGMIGFILSHEISHAINNIHRMFTNNRTIENGWSFTSNQKYNTTKTCLIDQYGNYLIEGTNKTVIIIIILRVIDSFFKNYSFNNFYPAQRYFNIFGKFS